MLTRRELLGVGAAAGAGLALSPRVRPVRASPGPAAFSVPLPLPPVLRPVRRGATTDFYELTTRRASVELLPGRRTAVWGYQGAFPGPTIEAVRGRRVVVRHRNRLPFAVNTHLHGAHVAAEHDGHPRDLIGPGEHRDYVFDNDQPAATLWYHDHTHHRTSRHLYMGLAGLYLLHDPAERALGLPSGPFDLPLILQDRSFTASGALRYQPDRFSVLGEVVLVNGRPQPFVAVGARRYRLRLVNASNSRAYRLRLSGGRPLTQIASDGGLLARPHRVTELILWPAERADVVVDFAGLAAGTQVVLENADAAGAAGRLLRFDVTGPAPDPSRVPERLAEIPSLRAALPAGAAAVVHTSRLGLDVVAQQWEINGRPFDSRRVDARVRRGRPEVWRLVNRDRMTHPMHFHNHPFQVLDRNGRPPPPRERGWKDTVAVGPRETVRIVVRFDRYLGRYVYHCHSLPHEDHAMMAQLEVVA